MSVRIPGIGSIQASSSAIVAPPERWPELVGGLSAQFHPADIWIGGGGGKPPTMAEIRDLGSFAYRSPVGSLKLACLQDADKLAVEAANALLKLVEEPPAYLRIVMLAALPRFLPTLRSRMHIYSLGAGDAAAGQSEWAAALDRLDRRDPRQRATAFQLLCWYPGVHQGIRVSSLLEPFIPQ